MNDINQNIPTPPPSSLDPVQQIAAPSYKVILIFFGIFTTVILFGGFIVFKNADVPVPVADSGADSILEETPPVIINDESMTPQDEVQRDTSEEDTYPYDIPIDPTIENRLVTFTEPRLQKVSFAYDPYEWTFYNKYTGDELDDVINHGLSGLYLTASHGQLHIKYTHQGPMGGGTGLFDKDTGIQLNNMLFRFRWENANNQTVYTYGSPSAVTLISNTREKTHNEFCADQSTQALLGFSDEDCAGILDGGIMGYVSFPHFSYSFHTQSNIPYSELFSPEFVAHYPDIDAVDITIDYIGTNPSSADKIVVQIAEGLVQ